MTVVRFPEPADWGWHQVAIALREQHQWRYDSEAIERMIAEIKPIYEHARKGAHIPAGASDDQRVEALDNWLTVFTFYLMGEIGRRDVALRDHGIDISEPFPL